MYRITLVLVAMLLPLTSIAEDWTGKLKGLTRGKSYEFVYGLDGSVSINPLPEVSVGKGPSNPTDPVDPDPMDPDPMDPAADKVILDLVSNLTKAALAKGGSKTTGAGLSSVYSVASDAVKQGKVKPQDSLEKVNEAVRGIMVFVDDDDAWTEWRTTISEAIATAESRGNIRTAEQYAHMYYLVARGSKTAVGFKFNPSDLLTANKAGFLDKAGLARLDATDGRADGILDGINLDMILKLIEFIMKLFEMFGG